MSLYAQEVIATRDDPYTWKLMPMKPRRFGLQNPDPASFPSTSVNLETHANHHTRTNHDWRWFESPALTKDVRIFGQPKVQIYSSSARKWITHTPTLVDLDMSDHIMAGGQHVGSTSTTGLVSITRGWLDSRYRDSLAKQKEVTPGKPFEMTVPLNPVDYTFKKGHHIGLQIQTEINEWSLPKPYPCDTPDCVFVNVHWAEAKTRVILPVVDAPRNTMSLFAFGHHNH